MSLYNMVHGENKDADKLVYMVDLERDAFGRFRDIYLNADGTSIIVYTRCGGSNRQEYDKVFEDMESHDEYIRDYDDEYDETYCYFEFSIPYDHQKEAKKMATGIEPETVHQKFDRAIKEMKDPNSQASKRGAEIAAKIEKGIKDNPNGGFIRL